MACLFRRVSKGLIGKRAEIQVASPAFGAQLEAKWLPLLGIVYDPKNDLVEIALEDLDHMIRTPRELYIDEGRSDWLARIFHQALARDAQTVSQLASPSSRVLTKYPG